MTVDNYMPAINNVVINTPGEEDSPVIKLKQNDVTEIELTFTLTGLNRITEPIFNSKRPFYIYIFLIFHEGGIGYNVVSSSSFYCDDNSLNHESLKFYTKLDITTNDNIELENFISCYYELRICHTEFEPQDGSDINMLVGHPAYSLFSTKLNIQTEGKSNES